VRLVGWLLALPLSLLAVIFAVANRHNLRLELWPLPWSLDLPVFLAVLGPLLVGLILGALLTWCAGHRTRANARTQRRRADSLERQLAQAHANTSAPQLPPPDSQGEG
jgi:uncharacterized integral membrane protein